MTNQRRAIFLLVPTLAIAILCIERFYGGPLTSVPDLLIVLAVASVLWAWRREVHRQLAGFEALAMNPEDLSAMKPLVFVFFGFYLVFISLLVSVVYFQWSRLFLPLCAVWLIRKELWCLLCANRLDKVRPQAANESVPPRHWLVRLLTGAVTFYAVLCAMMYMAQRSLIFIPSHEDPVTELRPWLHDNKTIGYCREVVRPRNIWLMMHGNAGQAAMRDYVLPRLSNDDSLYVLEYPGYGSRPGQPGREAFNQAAAEAYQLLRQQFPNMRINALGESIGSGPASALATQSPPPDKIVLIVPFDSLAAVAAEKFFWLPVKTLLLDNWNNIESLKNYPNPVEVYGAVHDEIIPVSHARHLAQQVAQAKLIEFEGGHNEWSWCNKINIRNE